MTTEHDQKLPAPDPESVQTAITVLQSELSLAHGDLDGIDRKAGLLPALLVALAGLLLPQGPLTPWQLVLVAIALVAGTTSVVMVLRLVWPGEVSLGPSAHDLSHNTHIAAQPFRLGVAIALAQSVEDNARRTVIKGRWLRRATWLAGVTMLALVLTRAAGGINLDGTRPAAHPDWQRHGDRPHCDSHTGDSRPGDSCVYRDGSGEHHHSGYNDRGPEPWSADRGQGWRGAEEH